MLYVNSQQLHYEWKKPVLMMRVNIVALDRMLVVHKNYFRPGVAWHVSDLKLRILYAYYVPVTVKLMTIQNSIVVGSDSSPRARG